MKVHVHNMYCIVLIVITCTFVIANIDELNNVCMILEEKAWASLYMYCLGDFLECACDILTLGGAYNLY